MLFPLIRWNVLPLERLAAISEEYNRRVLGHVPLLDAGEYVHVFWDLYRAGLLGHVAGDERDGRPQQIFPTIAVDGHLTFKRTVSCHLAPPTSSIRCSPATCSR